MANEFVHSSVGTTMTQAEFEAIGLHVCNSQATGDLIYASSSSQLSRLGIGATNKVLTVIGGVPTWQSTLAGLTLTSPTINGTIATTGLTLPAITLGGTANANGQLITNSSGISVQGAASIGVNADNSYVNLSGGTDTNSATIGLTGKTYGAAVGQILFFTPNDALGLTQRLSITGDADTAVATWSNVTHTGVVMSDHLTLYITDTDGATEGDIWYDASENKLKFYNGTAVETITSGA